jgi:hypothetical protein
VKHVVLLICLVQDESIVCVIYEYMRDFSFNIKYYRLSI